MLHDSVSFSILTSQYLNISGWHKAFSFVQVVFCCCCFCGVLFVCFCWKWQTAVCYLWSKTPYWNVTDHPDTRWDVSVCSNISSLSACSISPSALQGKHSWKEPLRKIKVGKKTVWTHQAASARSKPPVFFPTGPGRINIKLFTNPVKIIF